jgi:hypothetical protein
MNPTFSVASSHQDVNVRIFPLVNLFYHVEVVRDLSLGLKIVHATGDGFDKLIQLCKGIPGDTGRYSCCCLIQSFSSGYPDELASIEVISRSARLVRGVKMLGLFSMGLGTNYGDKIEVRDFCMNLDHVPFTWGDAWGAHGEDRSPDDLDRFAKYLDKIYSLITFPTTDNRVMRALNYFHDSFFCDRVTTKIVCLTMALEALFGTGSTETTYNLAHRIAWYIGKDGTERLILFEQIKKIYGVRSRVVHGGDATKHIGWNRRELIDDLEEIGRRVFSKIFDYNHENEFNASVGKLGAFFNRLVLDV